MKRIYVFEWISAGTSPLADPSLWIVVRACKAFDSSELAFSWIRALAKIRYPSEHPTAARAWRLVESFEITEA